MSLAQTTDESGVGGGCLVFLCCCENWYQTSLQRYAVLFPCDKEKSVAYSLLPLQGQGYEVCMHHV